MIHKYESLLEKIVLTWSETNEVFDINISGFIEELQKIHSQDKVSFQYLAQELGMAIKLFGNIGFEIILSLQNVSISNSGEFYEDLKYIGVSNNSIGTNEDDYISGTSNSDLILGEAGNDNITAGEGNDIIIGGTGDDYLDGSSGSDTYIYNLGDGFDTIREYGLNADVDIIKFGEGISKDSLSFRKDVSDLIILINGDETQGMRLQSFGYGRYKTIDELHFIDGSKIDLSKEGLTLIQTDQDEQVTGTESNDIIYGNGGNDYITTGGGDDYIDGGTGDDNITAGEGNDIIIGGTGDDYLDGSSGSDTYIYNLGDGFDTIREYGLNADVDIIKFGEGISKDSLSFRKDVSDLIILINGDETQGMRLQSFGYGRYRTIDELHFIDGSKIDLSHGLNANQLIQAMASFGAVSSATMSLDIDELNAVDNVIASSYANKVA